MHLLTTSWTLADAEWLCRVYHNIHWGLGSLMLGADGSNDSHLTSQNKLLLSFLQRVVATI